VGDHWCGGSHPGQVDYTQQSGSGAGVDASTQGYVWEKKGIGWRFCGLSEDECKAACIAMGPCEEVVISGNGCCYVAASRCVGTERTKDKKLIATTCGAVPPPRPPPPLPLVPHAVWTGHSSLPSIAIADAELHDAFLSRCKDTCLDTTDCIGFIEAGCNQDSCSLCEFKSATSANSFVVPDSHTYVWLDGSSRASSVKGSVFDEATLGTSYDEYDDSTTSTVDDYDDNSVTSTADIEAPPLQPDAGSPDDASPFTFSAAEVVAGISAAVLSGIVIGGLLVATCSRCRARCARK